MWLLTLEDALWYLEADARAMIMAASFITAQAGMIMSSAKDRKGIEQMLLRISGQRPPTLADIHTPEELAAIEEINRKQIEWIKNYGRN